MSHYSLGQTERPQLPDIQAELLKANAIVGLQLLRLFRLQNDEKEVARICDDLRDLIRQIRLMQDCCDGIVKSGRPRQREPFQVIVGPQCDNCLGPKYSSQHTEPTALLAQNKHVLTLISRITFSVFTTEHGPRLSQQLIDCIAGLRRLLVRQRRRFLEIERNYKPVVEVITVTEPYCICCGAEIPEMMTESSG